MSEKRKILKTALFSRLILIVLQYFANITIPDHDAGVFLYPKQSNYNFLDNLVFHLFGGFIRWDAQYFMHIANYGYTYENSLAFFPFSPILVKSIAVSLSFCIPFLCLESLILLTYITSNVVIFVLSAKCLYELSVLIVGEKLAAISTILFCFNPASIFFSAPYTECIYSYLSFKSMLNCILLYKKFYNEQISYLQSIEFIIPIALSVLTRSNGLLNIGFVVYSLLCLFKKEKQTNFYNIKLFLHFLLWCFQLCIICITPFILYQFYCYQLFCKNYETNLPNIIEDYGNLNNFILPGMFSKFNQSWCFNQIPLSYSYVQSHYWNVGFLRYYELKQIPNFLLATPVVAIILNKAFKYLYQFPKEVGHVFNFDLLFLEKRKKFNKDEPLMVVFVVHVTALVVLSLVNIHVQVITRMVCSASPVLYWFCGSYINQKQPAECNLLKYLFSKHCSAKECLIIGYFLGYYVTGTVLFCNFLPWT